MHAANTRRPRNFSVIFPIAENSPSLTTNSSTIILQRNKHTDDSDTVNVTPCNCSHASDWHAASMASTKNLPLLYMPSTYSPRASTTKNTRKYQNFRESRRLPGPTTPIRNSQSTKRTLILDATLRHNFPSFSIKRKFVRNKAEVVL